MWVCGFGGVLFACLIFWGVGLFCFVGVIFWFLGWGVFWLFFVLFGFFWYLFKNCYYYLLFIQVCFSTIEWSTRVGLIWKLISTSEELPAISVCLSFIFSSHILSLWKNSHWIGIARMGTVKLSKKTAVNPQLIGKER